MKKWIKYSLMTIAALSLTVFTVFYVWSQQTYQASNELEELVRPDDWIEEDGILTFLPEDPNDKGVILYPGAKVEPEAYAYYAKELSDEGYLVAIPSLRFNLALLDSNKAAEVIAGHPDVDTWVIGGHSLGGVAAASFASEEDQIAGVLFLASYPAGSADFSGSSLPMLSLFGGNDGLTSKDQIQESKDLLSQSAEVYEIEGGNHAQFGLYGEQKGDQPAAISALDQQNTMVQITLEWLEGIE
ncbi:alpha/beta hydrolase [Jeotgalibacillus sp. ET6]|uniref:alpha/beta hydrolase n=1 Tax=Jeotgalibacillus sp. ET6 TaxID=3037260 RepID=UPI0024182E0C|nr:alpha/beta hydrolase [Jeotgalibacillus sp. ET6]MDG5472252.1 alpha/beta hydrolase [Jeotgalibacillus sp. ET6]